MTRDLTEQQFNAALRRNGMRRGHFGYVVVTTRPDGSDGLHVYAGNAGDRRRDQLAYLLRKRNEEVDRLAGGAA